MTDYIVYWKYFWRDLEEYGTSIIIPEWHNNNEKVFNRLAKGDIIWVIIQGGSDHPDEWKLLQRIHIKLLEINHRKDKYEVQEYGHFHADGDPERSKIFQFDNQPDFTPILYKMEFVSGKRLTARGKLIGRSFQSIRPITKKDSQLLEEYSSFLNLFNR